MGISVDGVSAGYGEGYSYGGYGTGFGGFGYGFGGYGGDGYSGFGFGPGDGYGLGSVLRATDLPKVYVTAYMLLAAGACEEGVESFRQTFPSGATYPDDLDRAVAAGLDVGWITQLGLPMEAR